MHAKSQEPSQKGIVPHWVTMEIVSFWQQVPGMELRNLLLYTLSQHGSPRSAHPLQTPRQAYRACQGASHCAQQRMGRPQGPWRQPGQPAVQPPRCLQPQAISRPHSSWAMRHWRARVQHHQMMFPALSMQQWWKGQKSLASPRWCLRSARMGARCILQHLRRRDVDEQMGLLPARCGPALRARACKCGWARPWASPAAPRARQLRPCRLIRSKAGRSSTWALHWRMRSGASQAVPILAQQAGQRAGRRPWRWRWAAPRSDPAGTARRRCRER